VSTIILSSEAVFSVALDRLLKVGDAHVEGRVVREVGSPYSVNTKGGKGNMCRARDHVDVLSKNGATTEPASDFDERVLGA
jgi:hypothetical protein